MNKFNWFAQNMANSLMGILYEELDILKMGNTMKDWFGLLKNA
jgi:hypothetical protein